jgi:hypothetical protein
MPNRVEILDEFTLRTPTSENTLLSPVISSTPWEAVRWYVHYFQLSVRGLVIILDNPDESG